MCLWLSRMRDSLVVVEPAVILEPTALIVLLTQLYPTHSDPNMASCIRDGFSFLLLFTLQVCSLLLRCSFSAVLSLYDMVEMFFACQWGGFSVVSYPSA